MIVGCSPSDQRSSQITGDAEPAPHAEVATAQSAEDRLAKWKEDYAYSLGVQAYIFSYPWVYLSQIQYQWVSVTPEHPELTPNMPINRWWHGRDVITSDYRDGGATVRPPRATVHRARLDRPPGAW